jgi:type IV pilus assembly protein PilN
LSASIKHQQDRNDLLSREIASLDKQIEEINGLDAQKRRLLARMEIIETLQRSRPEIVHIFDEVVRVLPEGVYLTYLKQSGSRFELRGVAQSSTRVSSFMRNIDASEWLADPTLQIVEQKGADASSGADFTLFANQRSHAAPGEEEQTTAKAGKKKVAAK